MTRELEVSQRYEKDGAMGQLYRNSCTNSMTELVCVARKYQAYEEIRRVKNMSSSSLSSINIIVFSGVKGDV